MTHPQNTNTTIDAHDALNILANERRAHTITILSIYDEITITELAELLAKTDPEHENEPTAPIETALRHTHIPRLVHANIIEKTENTLTPGTHLKRVHTAYETFCSDLN
jgi:hypothetical protein